MTQVYTDGSYQSSNNQGGWAFVVVEDGKIVYEDYDGCKDTTNNRMEITAVLNALLYMYPKKFELITDSQYVLGTICKNWKIKKNQDLWERLLGDEKRLTNNVSFTWVKGHGDNAGNVRADFLACKGSNLWMS